MKDGKESKGRSEESESGFSRRAFLQAGALAAGGATLAPLAADAANDAAAQDFAVLSGDHHDIAGASKHVGRKPGEWNSLEINCRGQHVTTIHNGVMIVDVTPEKYPKISLRQLKGYLGLQNHGGGVKFRHLRVGPAIADYKMQPAK